MVDSLSLYQPDPASSSGSMPTCVAGIKALPEGQEDEGGSRLQQEDVLKEGGQQKRLF